MRKIVIRFCNFIFGKHKNNTLPRVWILAADMTIVIVSHSLDSLRGLCQRGIWINNGEVAMDGKCSDVIDSYLETCK